jgi:hypothetical protein
MFKKKNLNLYRSILTYFSPKCFYAGQVKMIWTCPKSTVFIYYIIRLPMMRWIESDLATSLSSFVISNGRCLN